MMCSEVHLMWENNMVYDRSSDLHGEGLRSVLVRVLTSRNFDLLSFKCDFIHIHFLGLSF